VRIIQSKLMAMGYSVGNTGIDGLYGPMTKGAIKRFQDDYGIQANGYVGGETATLLAYASHPSANVHRCKHAFLGIGR